MVLRTIAGKNALSYDLYNLEGSTLLANLIRHKLRNHNRIVQFTRLVPVLDVKNSVS
jgi:hypothetical protein